MNPEQIKALLRWLLTVGPLAGIALKWGLSGPLVDNLINVGMAFVVSGSALGSLVLSLVRHKEANQVLATKEVPGAAVAIDKTVASPEVVAIAEDRTVKKVELGVIVPATPAAVNKRFAS